MNTPAAQKIVAQTQAGMAKPGAGAAAGTSSPTDQLGSQFKDPTAYASQANSAIDKQEATAQQLGNDQIAANQRRAATLSALSGRGLGGGFAQALTQGTIEGINNEQAQINQLESQRQQIYGQEASQSFQNQQQNKQNAFGLEQTTAQNNAAATAQQMGAQQQTAVSNAEASLNSMGINVAAQNGPAWGTFKPLIDALNNATTPQQLAAAQAALNNAMGKLNQLKAQNKGKKGEDWNAVVKKAESSGYFNS